MLSVYLFDDQEDYRRGMCLSGSAAPTAEYKQTAATEFLLPVMIVSTAVFNSFDVQYMFVQ